MRQRQFRHFLQHALKWSAGLGVSLGVLTSLIAVVGLFTNRLPLYELHLPCPDFSQVQRYNESGEQRELTFDEAFTVYAEQRRVTHDFGTFASEHAGEIAYVSFFQCDVPHGELEEFGPERIHLTSSGDLESYDHTELPNRILIELPDPNSMKSSHLHVLSELDPELGVALSFRGPFVLPETFRGGSGGESFISLTPVADMIMWREVSCTNKSLVWPVWMRWAVPCF